MNLLPLANFADDSLGRGIALAVGVLGLAYLVLRPKLKRRRDPLSKPGGVATLGQHRAVERDMSHLLVELSEMARQITAQLDTRAAKLEALIDEADQKIAELRQAKAGAAAEAPPSPPAADSPPAIDPRHADVWRLADDGQSPQQIARRLDRPVGEIELILALRPAASGSA